MWDKYIGQVGIFPYFYKKKNGLSYKIPRIGNFERKTRNCQGNDVSRTP